MATTLHCTRRTYKVQFTINTAFLLVFLFLLILFLLFILLWNDIV